MTTPGLRSSSLLTWMNKIQLKGWILPTLTILFLTLSLSISVIVFFYPLEIETRESAVWLHVLAFKSGINIYDPRQVAFIKMHKGPFDPLFKFAIASLFPFLTGWQVTRFAVFLLPYAFLLVAWNLIPQVALKSGLHVLYLGSMGYLLIVLTGKEFILAGREDATAALFFLLLIYISITFAPKTNLTAALYGLLWGAMGTAVVLTNWRLTLLVIGVWIFRIWKYKAVEQRTGPCVLIYGLSCAIAGLSIWGFLLFYLFDLNLYRYWTLHFGFFTHASGWGAKPYYGSVFSFIRMLFNPYADPNDLKGGPLLLTFLAYALTPNRRDIERKSWILLGCFSMITIAISYYLNYVGGGQWYFIPFMIILWFFFIIHFSYLTELRLTLLGIVLLMLLLLNYQSVLLPTTQRLITMNLAGQFLATVRSLQKTHTVLSEDLFFFRTFYQGELIDSGDEVEAVAKTHYYGKEFNQTAQRHFDRTRDDPPDYILTGITQSSKLDALIKEKYELIETAPNNLTGNGSESSKLFQRKHLQ
jgi:hypothetical protein